MVGPEQLVKPKFVISLSATSMGSAVVGQLEGSDRPMPVPESDPESKVPLVNIFSTAFAAGIDARHTSMPKHSLRTKSNVGMPRNAVGALSTVGDHLCMEGLE